MVRERGEDIVYYILIVSFLILFLLFRCVSSVVGRSTRGVGTYLTKKKKEENKRREEKRKEEANKSIIQRYLWKIGTRECEV